MSSVSRRQSNRSEQVRTRRSQGEEDRAQEAAQRIKNPVRTPPVMTRGRITGMAGAPGARKRTQTNVRRAYYYTLPTSGAEVRLPALPKVQLGWRLLSGLLAIGLTVGILMIWTSPTFQIDQVRLVGAKRIAAVEVNTALSLTGMSILEADPTQLEQSLRSAFPEMESISIQVGLPADVVVRVTERKPILQWNQGNESKWIDSQGFAFPVRGEAVDVILVQADGNPPGNATEASKEEKPSTTASTKVLAKETEVKPFLTNDMIESIQKIGAQIPKDTPVLYNANYGLGWIDPQGGWKVYIGMRLENMDVKLKQYQVIVDDLNKRGIRPVMISVEYPHAPFYRVE